MKTGPYVQSTSVYTWANQPIAIIYTSTHMLNTLLGYLEQFSDWPNLLIKRNRHVIQCPHDPHDVSPSRLQHKGCVTIPPLNSLHQEEAWWLSTPWLKLMVPSKGSTFWYEGRGMWTAKSSHSYAILFHSTVIQFSIRCLNFSRVP